MKPITALVLVTALATVADADSAKGKLVSFKVVSQTPSALTSRAIFAGLDAVLPAVEACGDQKTPRTFAFGVALDIAADGTVTGVTVDKQIAAGARECLTKALSPATFAKPKRATKLQMALVYARTT
jgi:hypothetical protein